MILDYDALAYWPEYSPAQKQALDLMYTALYEARYRYEQPRGWAISREWAYKQLGGKPSAVFGVPVVTMYVSHEIDFVLLSTDSLNGL